MPKTTYQISLKGYVGGSNFNRSKVDKTLADNSGKQVNLLIDSLDGSLATGLSISTAFRNHGNVNVHFVGLNASAATILSHVYMPWIEPVGSLFSYNCFKCCRLHQILWCM